MKFMNSNMIDEEILHNPVRLEELLAETGTDVVIERKGMCVLVHGVLEVLTVLCNKTGGPGKVFSLNIDIKEISYLIARTGMSCGEVELIVKNA